MPLDSTRSYGPTAAVTEAFLDIGHINGTALPKAKGATEKIAWEYWVSSLLAQLAEVRREKAKRAAIAGGVLPDIAANPLPVGTTQAVYAGTLVTIGVKVVGQSDRVNVPALVADMLAAGFAPRVVKRLVKKHTRSFAGAHVFTASLVPA